MRKPPIRILLWECAALPRAGVRPEYRNLPAFGWSCHDGHSTGRSATLAEAILRAIRLAHPDPEAPIELRYYPLASPRHAVMMLAPGAHGPAQADVVAREFALFRTKWVGTDPLSEEDE